MGFAVVAEFPLGTYRGHRADGRLDPLPSPARLHAALLAAAGQGTRAETVGGHLVPCGADRAALAWLEGNPPDALGIPRTMVQAGVAQSYRAEGFFGVREKQLVLVSRSDLSGSVSLAAPLAWLWDEDPPVDVADALRDLCGDVSHLGTAETPVRLRIGDALATHRLDRGASVFSGAGLDVEIAMPGRTSVLEAAHVRDVGPPPPLRADQWSRNEKANIATLERSALARARYIDVAPGPPDAPWPSVVVLATDRKVPPEHRVSWAVALHRALISLIGDGAPTLVTGRYEQGVARPANRLAVQYVSASVPCSPVTGAPGAFVLLVPAGVDPADLATLDGAVRDLREVRLGLHATARITAPARNVTGGMFWGEVPAGMERVWVTDPAAIPESRPPRGRPWTIGDAALLSVGLVFRDRITAGIGGRGWRAAIADGARDQGAYVLEAHKLNAATGPRYVHHIGREVAVQPYRAALRLGTLAGERAIVAIGQTRHLGGGLLTPLDLPIGSLSVPSASDQAH